MYTIGKYLVKIALTGLAVFGLNNVGSAQRQFLSQATPKSPNVAGLDKVIETPVSLSTGKTDVNIPLYEINIGDLKIPISLNYDNNGFKPSNIPSWVGLGWNLFTGGHISYVQNGLNDFDPTRGLFAQGQILLNSYFSSQMNPSQQKVYFHDIVTRNTDAEYDEYYYSTPSGSGSFHFLSATEATTNPKSDFLVSKTSLGFKIEDGLGNTYFFESQEAISSQNTLDISPIFSDNSAYYITKIIASNGDIAEFTYTQYSFQYTTQNGSLMHTDMATLDCPSSSGNVNVDETLTRVYYLLPASITFPQGSVKFNHSSSYRQDLKLLTGAVGDVPCLSSIEVYDPNNAKLKGYNINTSYFGTNSRLRLDGIDEVSSGAISRKWRFDYYSLTQDLPSFNSKSVDHWGYANNSVTSSQIALPKANYAAILPNWNQYSTAYFIDKNSDFNSSIKGMLKTITYPTGGTTEFEYEGNQFKFNSFNDFNLSPFFELPASVINNSLVYADSWSYYDPVNGSMILPYSGYYKVSSFRQNSPDPFYQDASIVIQGNSSTAAALNHLFLYNLTNSDQVVYLEAGTYDYSVHGSEYWDNQLFETRYLRAWMQISGVTFPATFPVGGNRVKKITNTDIVNNSTIIKKYIYNDSFSNVNFKQMPYYITSIGKYYLPEGENKYYCVPCSTIDYTIYDFSVRPLVGAVIEYGKVTTLNDENGVIGKIDQEFLFSENIGGSLTAPFVAQRNTNWRVGKILKEYRYDNMSVLRQKTVNNYQSDFQGTQVNGLRVVPGTTCDVGGTIDFRVALATVFSEKFTISSSQNQLYNAVSSVAEDKTYTYNLANHSNPSTITSNSSDTGPKTSKVIYSFDYTNLSAANTPAANALKWLNNNHINLPIEELDIVERSGVKYITGGVLKVYKQNQSVPDQLYTLNLETPIQESGFVYSSITSAGEFIKDSRYILRVTYNRYDNLNNVLEQRQFQGMPTTYIWGYNGQHVVAEVKNAEYTLVESVLGGSSAISNFRDLKDPSLTIAGFLAPLRSSASLKNTEITTYTYKPLVGMTSETDPKGMTTYYEYDAFQRLKCVKDQGGNIIKSYDYHYKP